MIQKFPENKRVAIFPGSFNPFTIGHLDILKRGGELFDEIVVARCINIEKNVGNPDVSDLKFLEKRYGNVKVVGWNGLTCLLAKDIGAKFLLRGVRSMTDFDKERLLADINFRLEGIETVILVARPELSDISSSMVRELELFGYDVSRFYAANN